MHHLQLVSINTVVKCNMCNKDTEK